MTELTCIVCPRGCTLRIEERDGRFYRHRQCL